MEMNYCPLKNFEPQAQFLVGTRLVKTPNYGSCVGVKMSMHLAFYKVISQYNKRAEAEPRSTTQLEINDVSEPENGLVLLDNG